MKFTYSTGQKPLDGYTIKRGVGKGGFGEVYFALSDGGKEVALKLLRGDQADIELRGIRQCLNLKSPNLVALYDVKTDNHSQPWVVMEYVAGETLNAILNRHPKGLPLELVQQWFPSLGRAVGYLHDHGIVHRDLKPANIFLEHGILKVGDYGLSKSMSSSHRSAQTSSVGTVHYMAPEIASGNYDKSVDIYALGVLLYEMLTGAPPFDGESAQEVMMKHLMSLPDLNKVPGPFKAALGKALAKDPQHRHQTAAELVKEVEAIFADASVEAKPLPRSNPNPSPGPSRFASGGAMPVAVPVARPVGRAVEVPIPRQSGPATSKPEVRPARSALAPTPVPAGTVEPLQVIPVVVPMRVKLGELAGSMLVSVAFAGIAAVLLAALRLSDDMSALATMFFQTVAVCWAVLIPSKFWSGKPNEEWARRLVLMACGAMVGLGALWLDGWTMHVPSVTTEVATDSAATNSWTQNPVAVGAGLISYFGLALGLLRWWKIADRRRGTWFSFFPVLATGVWALLLMVVWPWHGRPYGVAALILSSMIVQWVSPWQPPPPPTPRRLKLRRV
jgi:eukaryotic-like serine/threonine-protein kinase